MFRPDGTLDNNDLIEHLIHSMGSGLRDPGDGNQAGAFQRGELGHAANLIGQLATRTLTDAEQAHLSKHMLDLSEQYRASLPQVSAA